MKASHSKSAKRKPVTVKLEKAEGNHAQKKVQVEHDLTYYVKDRVELMKQIFSILKGKELLGMAPDCLRSLSVDELQEALLDEVLGISSKRLHSILEGFECPSNTDSSEESSQEALETISLDSISSDDEILSQDQKSKKKHGKKKLKTDKTTKKKNKSTENISIKSSNAKGKKNKKEVNSNEVPTLEDGSGNGMTVLELLELQARARAIRAQLAAVEVKDKNTQEIDDKNNSSESSNSDEDEVVIKEEPPDIVEIQSSSDEKDNEDSKENAASVNQNTNEIIQKPTKSNQSSSRSSPVKTSIETPSASSSTTQQNQPSRKIKLNRNNIHVSLANSSKNGTNIVGSSPKSSENSIIVSQIANSSASQVEESDDQESTNNRIDLRKTIKEKVNNDKKFNSGNEKIDPSDLELLEKIKNDNLNKPAKTKPIVRERRDSGGDEITLELSDSEKMYLLDGFRSPKSHSVEINDNELILRQKVKNKSLNVNKDKSDSEDTNKSSNNEISTNRKRKIHNKNIRKRAKLKKDDKLKEIANDSSNVMNFEMVADDGIILDENVELFDNSSREKSDGECSHSSDDEEPINENSEILCISDDEMPKVKNSVEETVNNDVENKDNHEIKNDNTEIMSTTNKEIESKSLAVNDNVDKSTTNEEIESKSSAVNENEDKSVTNDVIEIKYVTDDETETLMDEKYKNIPEGTDENTNANETEMVNYHEKENSLDCVFEISDNSEDETNNVISKEPTREEIEELSRKVDYEIERENLDILENTQIDLKISDNENTSESKNETEESPEGMSWKTRWLKSNKVQRVLATSNLCNALRKKNIELKKKLESNAAKTTVEVSEKLPEVPMETACDNEQNKDDQDVEGSVSQYEKLVGSTKYVNPIQEPKTDDKAMVTDAKQLMKMYKKLLKIHSLDENGDGSKKKLKKNKKDKKREKKEKKKNKIKDIPPIESVSTEEASIDVNKDVSEK